MSDNIKKSDWLRCTDSSTYGGQLSFGKVYQVTDTCGGSVILVNDEGEETQWDVERSFEKVEEPAKAPAYVPPWDRGPAAHMVRAMGDEATKPSNPKDIVGSTKLPLHLWPTTATAMGCLGLLEGALKYGRLNWRKDGVRASIYVDACKRHLDAWMEGEDDAPDSGSPHLANALSCIAIIVDAMAVGKLTDDRNYNGAGYREFVEGLTPHVPRLKELFKDKDPKHWTIADNVPA